MKKYLYNIFCICFMLSFYSCNETQEDIFDKTPNQRIQERENELKEILVGQSQGWQMLYFPLVENRFSDIDKNLKATKDYGVLFIERDYGKGGHNIFMNFKENGEVEMLYDGDFNSTREIKTSRYTLSQNTYTQLDFISPNYIFETGQTGFLFYKKNEDGSLVFTTNKYAQRNKEYILLKPLATDMDWKARMATIYQTKLAYERKQLKTLTVTSPFGDEVFSNKNFLKSKHTDSNLRYSVFVRNMQPHIYNSNYFTGLGSGYMPMENKMLFLPGIKVNDSVNFTVFEKKGSTFIAEEKGYKAVIN
ncbi:DUF4302 domain-containing protein [Weeksellaceae bacterium TAE3-ERU29]|nr:DUF4302 domain-containing protein [Weeksellaceae bacterium TAE3-ERU29]